MIASGDTSIVDTGVDMSVAVTNVSVEIGSEVDNCDISGLHPIIKTG